MPWELRMLRKSASKGPRTLLGTPKRAIIWKAIVGGYVLFGIDEGIQRVLEDLVANNCEEFHL